MKFRKLLGWLLGATILFLAACSSTTPTTNQTAPTLAPVDTVQPTSAPAATNALPTQPMSAQPTQAVSAQATAAPTQTEAAPAPTAANNPPASGSSAFDLIVSAMEAQMSAKSFRMTSTTTGGEAGNTSTVIEYVAPDRIHVTRTSPSVSSEIIAIKGQGSWQKENGKWAKSPIDMSSAIFAFLDPKNIQDLKNTVDIGTVQFLGPELLGTTPTFTYQYNQVIKGAGPGGADLNGTYKIWLGVTDRRVYKVEGDTDSATKVGAKTHSVITYEYDVSIQIQPPI